VTEIKHEIESAINLLQELGMEAVEVYEYIDSIREVISIKLQDPEA